MPRKGENIYKRKDGRWEGRYIKDRDSRNKAKYGYVYAKTYTEVKHKLSAVKSLNTGQNRIIKNTNSFEYFCVKWLENIKPQVKRSTYVKYFNLVQNHILPILGKNMISVLDTAAIRHFANEKLSYGKLIGPGGLSPKTVKDILSVIKLIFRYAANSGVDCQCDFDNIKIKSRDKGLAVMTRNEQERFTSYLMSEPNNIKLGIMISLYAGLRIGELCALKFEDISDGIIHVTKTMQRIQKLDNADKKTEVIITQPKSASSIREIPVPDFLNELILKFYTPKAYVLTGEAGTYIEPRTMQNKFKSCVEDCGLHGMNFHICRHTYASACIEVGVEIKSLSEILGHSNVNITLNRYVHSSMEMKRRNIEKLQERFIYSPS